MNNTYGCRRRRFIPAAGKPQLPLIFALLVLTLSFILLSGASWAATRTAASCSAADVQAAIDAAIAGDTVMVPSGSASWSGGVYLRKAITLKGGNGGTTTITDGSLNFIANDARFCYFTFTGGSIEVSGCTRGLIDHITLNSTSASIEFIHVYGPNNAWASDSTIGTAENIFVEDCSFTAGGGSAQCTHVNYNGRVVFRHNTITSMKFDMHGIWSNGSPSNYCNWTTYTDPGYISNAHSARHCEVYANTWNGGASNGCMELRGGTGVIYNNTMTIGAAADSITLRDYCASSTDGNCCGTKCPANYPWRDQIGRGKNQTLEPMYLWNNTANGDQLVGYYHSETPNDWHKIIHFESILSAAHVTACGELDPGWTSGGATMCDMTSVAQENRDYYVSQRSGYVAYTYPHPLQGVAPAGAPSPPTGLKIIQYMLRHLTPTT